MNVIAHWGFVCFHVLFGCVLIHCFCCYQLRNVYLCAPILRYYDEFNLGGFCTQAMSEINMTSRIPVFLILVSPSNQRSNKLLYNPYVLLFILGCSLTSRIFHQSPFFATQRVHRIQEFSQLINAEQRKRPGYDCFIQSHGAPYRHGESRRS